MSHVIDYSPEQVDQKLRDLNALSLALQFITTASGQQALRLRLMQGCVIGEDGLVYRDGKVVTKGNAQYRTWASDNGGELVGDWPLPQGMTAKDVGANAVAVVEMTPEAKAEYKKMNAYDQPYEVGVIPRLNPETGEMTYSLTHDFFNGGNGLEKYIGETKVKYPPGGGPAKVEEAHGQLMMFYQMAAAKMQADAVGIDIEYERLEDGSYKAKVDKRTEAHKVLA